MKMCRYRKKCNYFDNTAVCCNDDNEAKGYCGKWIQFHEKERKIIRCKLCGIILLETEEGYCPECSKKVNGWK